MNKNKNVYQFASWVVTLLFIGIVFCCLTYYGFVFYGKTKLVFEFYQFNSYLFLCFMIMWVFIFLFKLKKQNIDIKNDIGVIIEKMNNMDLFLEKFSSAYNINHNELVNLINSGRDISQIEYHNLINLINSNQDLTIDIMLNKEECDYEK